MEKQKNLAPSIRVELPRSLYARLKKFSPDHGDISKAVRHLLNGYLSELERLEAQGKALMDTARAMGKELAAKRTLG